MATLDRLAPPLPSTPAASAWSPRRAIAAALFFAAAIALLQVIQSSGFAHTGQTMQRLEQRKADLNADIHELQAEIAALASLDRTERAARERLGMVPARRLEHISVSVEPPSGVLLPRPIISIEPPPAGEAPWWQSLFQKLPTP